MEQRFTTGSFPGLFNALSTSSLRIFPPAPEGAIVAGSRCLSEIISVGEGTYQVGESHFRAGLHEPPGDAGYRDLAAEQALLDRLRLGGIPEDMVASARLGGLETVRFTTELLPLLTGQPGVTVEVTGDVADYREVSDSLCIGVSTAEIAGDNDWFDLGVTITVEGREVPFADVFTALAAGESHLLLPDGAYFCWTSPNCASCAA